MIVQGQIKILNLVFPQKLNHPGDNFLVGVFHHIMTRLLHLMHFCIREIFFPTVKKVLGKAEILHAPDDHRRTVSEISQLRFDMLHHGVTGDIRRQGDILNKSQISDPVLRRVVGRQVSLPHLAHHAVGLFAGPRSRHPREQVEFENRKGSDDGVSAQVDAEWNAIGNKSRGVEKNEAFDFFRSTHGQAHPNRSAPIVHHQSQVVQVQVIDQCGQVIDVLREGVIVFLRFVGQPAPDMIRHHTAVLTSQSFDEVAVVKRPGRVAVKHEKGFALPFIEVMHAVGTQFDEPGFERIQVAKRFYG